MAAVSQRDLMQAFQFTEADLLANRDRAISDQQKLYWQQHAKRTTVIFNWGGVGLILLAAIWFHFLVQRNGSIWLTLIVLLIGFAVLWTVGELLNPATDWLKDVQKGQTHSICGTVECLVFKETSGLASRSIYKIRVEKIKFHVNAQKWSAFQNGKSYCIYYMPESEIILSAEALD